jgi:hypothetical protein
MSSIGRSRLRGIQSDLLLGQKARARKGCNVHGCTGECGHLTVENWLEIRLEREIPCQLLAHPLFPSFRYTIELLVGDNTVMHRVRSEVSLSFE